MAQPPKCLVYRGPYQPPYEDCAIYSETTALGTRTLRSGAGIASGLGRLLLRLRLRGRRRRRRFRFSGRLRSRLRLQPKAGTGRVSRGEGEVVQG